MTRPKLRKQTVKFSKKALICERDAQLCLMFRVGNIRKTQIVGANIRAYLIKTIKTAEGEILNNYQTKLEVHTDGRNDGNDLFIWPTTIVHKFDTNSPFYRLSAIDFMNSKFEIAVILEGTIESTGTFIQARTSYLPSDLLLDHNFQSPVSYNQNRQCYKVDFFKFNNTIPVGTPLSEEEINEFQDSQQISCNFLNIFK